MKPHYSKHERDPLFFARQLSRRKEAINELIAKSTAEPQEVIARYTAAIAVNFTDWIGKTTPFVRHEKSYQVLVDNMRCESVDDHVGMLYGFAKSAKALPDKSHYTFVDKEVKAIRQLFKKPFETGLQGLVVCAFLENTSEIFIPDLAIKAQLCGSKNLAYTNVHGIADIEHSKSFIEAVKAELTMGYKRADTLIEWPIWQTQKLIEKIYQ